MQIPSSLLPSLLRTLVPLTVGWLLSLVLVDRVLDFFDVVSADAEQALTAAVTAVLTFAYYLLVRLFEQYVSPRLGWLLGLAQQPAYAKVENGVAVITTLPVTPASQPDIRRLSVTGNSGALLVDDTDPGPGYRRAADDPSEV